MSIITDNTGAGSETRRTTSAGRAVGLAVLVTVVALLFNIVAGVALLIPLFVLEVDVQSTPSFVGLAATGQLGFLAAAYAVARYRGMQIPIAMPDGRQAGYAVGGTVTALALAVGLSYLLSSLGLTPGSVIEDAAVDDPALYLWLGGLSVILIAPVEEFLFRGVVQGTLCEAFGAGGAIAGASLLFGSLHLANYTGDPAAVVAGALLIAAIGSVFGVLYEVTDNLAVPVAGHATYNLFLLVISYLAV